MKVAVFTGHFPVISETFILRQLTSLIDRGHEVWVFADWAPGDAERRIWGDVWPANAPVHPEISTYDLAARTVYMDMPLATGYWQRPVWPLTGKTWLPEEEKPILNLRRLAAAVPAFARAFATSPTLAVQALDDRRYGSEARSLAALYRLARLCREQRSPDVLHAHFGWSGNNFRFARRLWRAPLIASFHGGGDLRLNDGVDPVEHYRGLFAEAEAITANSRYTRELLERAGCPSYKIHVLEEGLRVEDFPFRERRPPTEGPVRVLSVGRLVAMKGHEYTIRALARVRRRHPNVRLDIVGEGELRRHHERLIAELGLDDAVTLHGSLPADRVRRMFEQAHLFVMASVTTSRGETEGQGLALQEAQCCGLSVIATDHGPFPDGIVPDRSGFLVPERDAEALAERLERLVEHPETWPRMGHVGRAYVERRYDVRRLTERLEALYESVRAAGPSTSPDTRDRTLVQQP